MNIRAQPIIEDRITRLFSVADIHAMIEAGIMSSDERVELIEGVLVQMAAKNRAHELIKNWLTLYAVDHRGDDYTLSVEGSFYLAGHTFIEPDLLFHAPGTVITELEGPDAILAIEVADSSICYDLGRKAEIYAQYGVRELWVIDANRRRTFVHRRPSIQEYATIDCREADATISPLAVPRFKMRLKDAN